MIEYRRRVARVGELDQEERAGNVEGERAGRGGKSGRGGRGGRSGSWEGW